LLGIAYAASIGGMSTLVGTAPNIIFVGFIQETYGIEISFVDWMKLGVP
jgi:sodium-dependent dicarboxylate transporter 2/3/5